jgi:predicted permease
MRVFRALLLRVSGLFGKPRRDREFSEELDGHLDAHIADNVRAGMTSDQARQQALIALGGIESVKEQYRDRRGLPVVETLVQDIHYALRTLRKDPGFTVVVVLTLALGIGANTTMFTLVEALLLRTLPAPQPQQLVEVSGLGGGTLSYPMYEVIRQRNQVFSGVLTMSSGRLTASARLGDIDAGDVHVSSVSGDYFATLGVAPALGRGLTDEDLAAVNNTVISYALWQRAFNGDSTILGKPLRVGDQSYTIIGVAPADFTGVITGQPADVWVPITRVGLALLQNPVALTLRVMARRKAGVSDEQARVNMEVLARQWSTEWKFERPMQVEVVSASGGLTLIRRRFSRPLLVLMTVVVLLLLITAVNVANLLLARASARQREMGIRLSLGASRGRLIRQLLTESLVLGAAGAALGLLLRPGATAFLVRFLSSGVGEIDLPVRLDSTVLLFTLMTSFAVVLLFGLAPALATTRIDIASLFKGPPTASTRTKGGPRSLLVVAQVTVSCVLLVGALLFARSLQNLTNVDAGFQPENVLLLQPRTSSQGPTGSERVRLFERVLNRLANTPGVQSAALSSESLFSGNSWTEAVTVPGFTPRPGENQEAVLLVISPGFFRTMATPVLRGRDFDSRDEARSPKAAIVNEAMARNYFGETEVVGRTFRIAQHDFAEPFTVVGVVRDAKYKSLRESAPRIIYLPYVQTPGPVAAPTFAVRTATNPDNMTRLLWKEIRDESPDLRFGATTTQARLVEGTIAQDRMLAQLSGFFGLTAAALVFLGLYGLTAYEVSRRTAEIGIRIALGAQPVHVARMVLGRSMVVVASGVALGLGAAVALAGAVESLLFEVHRTDLVALALSAVMLLGVAAVAAYRPARRAASLDPVICLRT